MSKEQLKNLPTPELDDHLQAELRKDIPDGDLVREILRVLEEREKDQPVEITPQIREAWKKINRTEQGRTDRPEPTARSWVKNAAAVVATAAALCFVLLGVIPQPAKAETMLERIAKWTDSVFSFVSSKDETVGEQEYIFQTDNSGLQKLYDTVTELGVVVPVVPMWLPGGLELTECKKIQSKEKTSVCATFEGESGNEIVYKLDVFDSDTNWELQKDSSDVVEFEASGIKHSIMNNKGNRVAAWSNSKCVCSISIKSPDDMYRILRSIYTWEES